MHLTIGELADAYEALKAPLPEDITGDISFRFGLMASKLEREYREFSKKRDELITKYGESKDDKPKAIGPQMKGWVQFQKDLEAFRDTELEDFHAYTIKLSLVADSAGLGNILRGIFPLIVDDLGISGENEAAAPAPGPEKPGAKGAHGK
jgi:hypothetical protein